MKKNFVLCTFMALASVAFSQNVEIQTLKNPKFKKIIISGFESYWNQDFGGCSGDSTDKVSLIFMLSQPGNPTVPAVVFNEDLPYRSNKKVITLGLPEFYPEDKNDSLILKFEYFFDVCGTLTPVVGVSSSSKNKYAETNSIKYLVIK